MAKTVTMKLRLPEHIPANIEAQLRDASDELDEVLSALSLGLRNQAQFDALEQRGQRVAANIRKAFRG